jgi:hypothetical protein
MEAMRATADLRQGNRAADKAIDGAGALRQGFRQIEGIDHRAACGAGVGAVDQLHAQYFVSCLEIRQDK